ncbi:MAG TPA: tetratricopeptide repeat protein [Gemmatimonadales bacterium]|nr:tetratricopeptide repeat protein [Gemmatimonadales bacterium]
MNPQPVPPPARNAPRAGGSVAADVLRQARDREHYGALTEAAAGYDAAAALARREGNLAIVSEAMRCRAVVHHHANERAEALRLCRASHEVARQLGDDLLSAEALNALGGMQLEAGDVDAAHESFRQASRLAGARAELCARIEQNLGIVANIRGDLDGARSHYARALAAHRAAGANRGCAIVEHNLGMVCADQRRWREAAGHYERSMALARALPDRHLEGLCLLNGAEALLALDQPEEAQRQAEGALRIFEELGTRLDMADAFKVLGMVLASAGRAAAAEWRLQSAIELAASTGSLLSEAEASRELAVLYRSIGRPRPALALLTSAHSLFSRVGARGDLADLRATLGELEDAYLAAVLADPSLTSDGDGGPGHGARVAAYALRVADALGLDATDRATLRIGAHLHHVGLECLAGLDCPWPIAPIVRSHREKYDGSGYPDGLAGDAIPLHAQMVCIADVYDALTSERSCRTALAPRDAVARMREVAHWWRPDVLAAFLRCVADRPELAA